MSDAVVTVPMGLWQDWIAEGDLPGESWSGLESHFYCRPPGWVKPGARLYIVAHGKLRGYAPIVRVEARAIVRRGSAEAVTIDEQIRGFQGVRRRWWDTRDEKPFPGWRIAKEGMDSVVPIEWQTQEEFRRDYPPPQEESHNAKGVPTATPSGEKEKSLDTT